MNDKFAKTALAAGVVAAMGYTTEASSASLVAAANDVVVLGCSVPSAGTTVSTVYSIDATSTTNSTYTISLPTTVAVGASCAAALAGLTTAVSGTSVTFTLAGNSNTAATPANFAIPGTGYTLQTFTLTGTTTASTATAATGFIGCSAPSAGTTGATVYSVDATNVTGSYSTNITALNALVGKPCSYALGQASKATGTGFAPSTSTYSGQAILTINSNGYALNQYTFQ